MKLCTCIFPSYYLCLSFVVMVAESSVEDTLRKHILANNTAVSRPVRNPERVLNVTFNLQLWNVLAINEKEQIVKVYCEYAMRWKNQFITWDPKEWDNVSSIYLSPENIWIPDIVLLNSADAAPDNIQRNTDIVGVDHNGDMSYAPKVILTASFIADTKLFPFDSQIFVFTFESWTFTSNKLQIKRNNKQMVYDHFVNNTQWELIKTEKVVSIKLYSNKTNAYTNIQFKYTFFRRPSYMIMTLILPIMVLVLIVLFSYFLPAASGERMGVMITVLLTFAVFLQVVSSSLPQNSNSTAFLSIYILLTMCECTLSFFSTCLVIMLLHKGAAKDSRPPPHWVTRYLLCSCRTRPKPHSNGDIEAQKETSSFLCENGEQEYNQNLLQIRDDAVEVRQRTTLGNPLEVKGLREILAHVERVTAQQESETEIQREQEKVQMDWIRLAGIVDRMSYWAFLLLSVSSLSIMVVAYKQSA